MKGVVANKRVFWSYKNTVTVQTGATNVCIDFVPAAKSAMLALEGSIGHNDDVASVTVISTLNADNGPIRYVASLAATAAGVSSFPQAVNLATASGYLSASVGGVFVANPGKFGMETGSIAVGHIVTVVLFAELLGTETAPTVSVARSGTAANAPLGAASENTVTVVYT